MQVLLMYLHCSYLLASNDCRQANCRAEARRHAVHNPLEDGREFSVDSGGSVEIDVSANGGDRITVFDASENREYRIPVAAIARISIPEDLDDQRRWTKIG